VGTGVGLGRFRAVNRSERSPRCAGRGRRRDRPRRSDR
jgi:hypothetical protein